MSGHFSIIFKKMEELGAEQTELQSDKSHIRIIYPDQANASAEEMDEIAELRRVVHEVTEDDTISYTTT